MAPWAAVATVISLVAFFSLALSNQLSKGLGGRDQSWSPGSLTGKSTMVEADLESRMPGVSPGVAVMSFRLSLVFQC